MSNKQNKMISTGLLLGSANAAAGASHVTCAQIAHVQGRALANAIDREFQVVRLSLDWNSALEVTDDEEGNNHIFTSDSGRSILIPIESSRLTAPNKFQSEQ